MRKLIQKRYVLRQNIMMVIGVCLSFYFAFHLLAGERGYFRLMALENKVEAVKVELTTTEQARNDLEQKVIMMRPGTMNKDLLEERIRSVLGYRYENELVLLQNRS